MHQKNPQSAPIPVIPLLGDVIILPTKKMSSSLRASNGFIPAKVAEGKRCYVEFYCLDPDEKDLDLPSEYKFYSLKDTGITDLIKDRTDLLSIRDQARHLFFLFGGENLLPQWFRGMRTGRSCHR